MKKSVLLILATALMLLAAGGCGVFNEPEPTRPSVITFAPSTPQPITDAPAIEYNDGGDEAADAGATDAAIGFDFSGLYMDDIVWLGDSTTYGMKYYAVLPGGKETKNVWTPLSGTLTLDHQGYATIVYPPSGEEITIREAAEAAKPAILVITLGVNGVSFLDETTFKAEYADLIEGVLAASPKTKVVAQSIFPVASNYDKLTAINNDKIEAANEWIAAVALEYEIPFVDTYPELLTDDSWLKDEFQNGDGLHLGSDGFEVVLGNVEATLGITWREN
jgi:lysophospholipase L1-like esterase